LEETVLSVGKEIQSNSIQPTRVPDHLVELNAISVGLKKILDSKSGMVAHVCYLRYSGDTGRRIAIEGSLGKVRETLSQKKNTKQKG
jgi:hypothetical protein